MAKMANSRTTELRRRISSSTLEALIRMFGVIAALLALSLTSAFAKGCNKQIGPEDFCGSYRASPKTSYVTADDGAFAQPIKVDSVSALLQRLPSDADMRSKYEWGLHNAPGHRVTEELYNVELTGYIVAVKPCESDRDYHVILKDNGARKFMNVEVSGLPTDGKDKAIFQRARSEIESVLSAANAPDTCGKYDRLPQPAHVKVTGSAFFDGDHRAGCRSGCPGPSYAKPSTVWEIHPVYNIETIP